MHLEGNLHMMALFIHWMGCCPSSIFLIWWSPSLPRACRWGAWCTVSLGQHASGSTTSPPLNTHASVIPRALVKVDFPGTQEVGTPRFFFPRSVGQKPMKSSIHRLGVLLHSFKRCIVFALCRIQRSWRVKAMVLGIEHMTILSVIWSLNHWVTTTNSTNSHWFSAIFCCSVGSMDKVLIIV